jgi:hypothetical protein
MNPKTETAGETPAYLSPITVGELARFLGQQCVEAGRAGEQNFDMLKHLVLMADGVEKALKFYNKCALLPCGDGGNQMTPTPRTDNLSEFGRHYPVAHGSMEQLARDLELENNDLREVLNKLTDSYFLHRCEGMLELMMQADRLRPLDMKGDK